MNTFYSRLVFVVSIALCSQVVFSQVGIGTTVPNGALEVSSTNSGVVPPRVALSDITIFAPIVNPNGGGAPVAGTFVWNTATSGVPPNNVAPGLYYWDGVRWISFAGSPGGLDWSLKGNSGTNNGTDFLGTTDPEPLVIKVNSIERIRMGTAETVVNEDAQNYDFRVEGTGETELFFVDANTNHVHIRAASPFPTIDMFTSVSVANDYPINGYASGQNNAGVYGRHATAATGANMSSGGAFDGIGTGFSTQPGWNVGVVGTGDQAGVYGTSTSGGLDVQGGYFEESLGGTVYATGRVAGFDGTGFFDYGGYFDGGVTGGDYARVGFNDGVTDFKIQGPGSVSTVVKDEQGENRVLFCPEAPEILFQDYGTGQLVNGEAYITIDPILAKNIFVDKDHPLKVFIQLEGDCKGVYVTEKTDKGFKVSELQKGKSNVPFSWSLTASRADRIENGIVKSKHVNVRFPKGQKRIVPNDSNVSKISNDVAFVQPLRKRK